jgi:hypothetical protein
MQPAEPQPTDRAQLVQWPHDAKDATRGRVGRHALFLASFWIGTCIGYIDINHPERLRYENEGERLGGYFIRGITDGVLPVRAALPDLPHCVDCADESAAALAALAADIAAAATIAAVSASAAIAAAAIAVATLATLASAGPTVASAGTRDDWAYRGRFNRRPDRPCPRLHALSSLLQ